MADQDNADRDRLRVLIHDEIFNQPVKKKRRKRAKSAYVRKAEKLVSDSEEEDGIEAQAKLHADHVHWEVTSPRQNVLGRQQHQDGRKLTEEPTHTLHQIGNTKEQPNKDRQDGGETSLEQQAKRRHSERIFSASSLADSVENELFGKNNKQDRPDGGETSLEQQAKRRHSERIFSASSMADSVENELYDRTDIQNAKGLKSPEPLPWSPEPNNLKDDSYENDAWEVEEDGEQNTSYNPSWTPQPTFEETLYRNETNQPDRILPAGKQDAPIRPPTSPSGQPFLQIQPQTSPPRQPPAPIQPSTSPPGQMPASIQPQAGQPPASIQPQAGQPPAPIQPQAGQPPASIQPQAGQPPASIQPQAGQPPASIQPQAGQPPASIQPQAGQPPASIQPQAGQPPASIQPQAGQPPASIQPQAGQPPASIQPQAGQPPAPIQPQARQPPAPIQPQAGQPPAPIQPQAGQPPAPIQPQAGQPPAPIQPQAGQPPAPIQPQAGQPPAPIQPQAGQPPASIQPQAGQPPASIQPQAGQPPASIQPQAGQPPAPIQPQTPQAGQMPASIQPSTSPPGQEKERRQGDEALKESVSQNETRHKPAQNETSQQPNDPTPVRRKNAVVIGQRPKSGFLSRIKQTFTKTIDKDEESDEDEDPSSVTLQFHLVIKLEDLPENELSICHYLTTEDKEEVITTQMKHVEDFTPRKKHVLYFTCECKFNMNYLKNGTKKCYKYNLDGERRRAIKLNWDLNALEPILHHYDGLIRPAGDIALVQEVARLCMLPKWKSLKADFNSNGLSAAIFIQQIEQVNQQCIQIQLKNQPDQSQVFRKYVEIKFNQLSKLQEKESTNMKAVISCLIILYISERHNLDFSPADNDILIHFLSPTPTGEWLESFDAFQKIHFSHPFVARTLQLRLIWYINIIMVEKKSTVFRILQLVSMLHFMKGENLIEMDHSTKYSAEWWGFSNLEKSVMTLIERLHQFKKERLLNKDQLETLLDLSAHDPILKRSMTFLVNRIDLERFTDQMPISILIAKWRHLKEKEDNIWMMGVVCKSLKSTENSEFPLELIKMLGECGLETIKHSDYHRLKKSLLFIQEFLWHVYLQHKMVLQDYCQQYAHCCRDQINAYLDKDINKFFETQDLWEMLFELKVKDASAKKLWDDIFTSLFKRQLQQTSEQGRLDWFCHQTGQNMIESIPEECRRIVYQTLKTFCHHRGREKPMINYLFNKVGENGFKKEQINWVALQMLISQLPNPLPHIIKDELFARNLALIAKTGENTNKPNEINALTDEMEQVCNDLESGNLYLNVVYILLGYNEHFIHVVEHLIDLHWVDCNLPLKNLLHQCGYIITRLNETRQLIRYAEEFITEIEPVETDIFQRNTDFKPAAIQLKHLVNWPFSEEENIEIKYFELSDEIRKMFEDMEKNNPSIVFHKIWVDVKSDLDKKGPNQEILPISMNDVIAKVWYPAVNKWQQLQQELKSGEILMSSVKKYFMDREGGSLVDEIEFLAGKKHNEKLKEIKGVLKLYHLQEILEVLNELQMKYGYDVEVHTLHVNGDHSLEEAKEILETFEKSTQANIIDITREQLEAINIYTKCIKVVKWIQLNIQNELEVKNLIDIAMASVKGHGAHEMQRAVCLRSAINGYAPLLFLKTDDIDFYRLIRECRKVFENLKKDENIKINLDTVNGFLPWLKTIRGTQGSEASNDMERIGRILRDSEIKVGDESEQDGKILTLEDIIHVKITEKDYQEDFGNSELVDMQSKVMLLVGTDEKEYDERQNIETYEEILECLHRIGNMFIYSQNVGNMALRKFKVKIVNKKDQSHVHLTMGKETKRSSWPTTEVSNQLINIARCLEACVAQWNKYLIFCRENFYHLNYFQTRQLTILRTILASKNTFQLKDLMLFYPVKYMCKERDIANASKEAKSQRMKVKPFVFETYQTEEDEFNRKLADLHKRVCASYETDDPFLSLSYIGLFLETLAKDSTKNHHDMKRIPTLKTGEPNLIALPCGEILFAMLSLYKVSSLEDQEEFPSSNEVLYCTEKTTVDEVGVFWRRAINKAAAQQLFCLANADMMTFDVADKVAQELEELKDNQCEYQLVVLCAIDGNNLSHLQTCLEPYKRNIVVDDVKTLKTFVQEKLCTNANKNQYSVRVVMSEKAGMGKSLLIRNSAIAEDTYVKIPVFSRHIKEHELASHLLEHEELSRDRNFVIHIDLHHDIFQSMDRILFLLTVTGRLETKEGYIWCPLPNYSIMVENQPLMIDNKAQKFCLEMLNVLPSCMCHSPQDSLDKDDNVRTAEGDQFVHENQFKDFLPTVSYLDQLNKNKPVMFSKDGNVGNGFKSQQALRIALKHCGIDGCSWAELVYFLRFLKQQFDDCAHSAFCTIGRTEDDHLPRFNEFVLRFLSDMAKDFSTRSIEISEQRSNRQKKIKTTLPGLQLKRKWEDSSHPYLFFNEDRTTFSFMGFIVDENTFELKDPSGKILKDPSGKTIIMQESLFEALKNNGVDLKDRFEDKDRQFKLDTLHKIIGGTNTDPDTSFVLTPDNVKKILAIDMRFRCGIPVVIMGETGCGKTRLVNFLCSLKLKGQVKPNMIIVKVHGGTTKEHIYEAVKDAKEKANENKFDTVLFFDEANTTSEIGLLKEIICDHSMRGKPLDNKYLRIIAAVNPYRRHSPEMIENIEKSGLGYHVSAEETTEKFGSIPMRELVYRVQRLPERMVHLVWDFGQLDETNEKDYIQHMVKKELSDIAKPKKVKVITMILAKTQQYMRDQKSECKFVSLRDVERTLHVLLWFYKHQDPLFKLMDNSDPDNMDYTAPKPLIRALILSLGVCYIASLSDKNAFVRCIHKYFEDSLPQGAGIGTEIRRCMDVFMDNVDVAPSIAKNLSLKENIFMMIMCIELRIPLFVVGRPGSSKSLAKTIVMDVMQGPMSKGELFQTFKEIQMISYQCSPMSTPDGIVNVFRQCAEMQKNQDLNQFAGVAVLDEIGLAEDSPKMPLKSLHPLLEDGCEGHEKVEPYRKVAFLGISNWALDPAKMNRGILVKRNEPGTKELEKTARGIAKGFQQVRAKLAKYYKLFAEAYHKLYSRSSEKKEFFGLRDFYSFIKMVCSSVKNKSIGEELTWIDVHYAILRNFGGLESVDPVEIFREHLQSAEIPNLNEDLGCSEFDLIHAGLKGEGLEGVESISRYTLVMVENLGALEILQNHFMDKDTVILFGSSFPKDQEYTQICRNINRIKICMETGKKVILLNMDNLYESLYDCLNQYYIKLGGDNFVDLGLGTHRIKCQVHKDFRITLVAEKLVVYTSYPIALVNRLEKHFLLTHSILNQDEKRIVTELKQWVNQFVSLSRDTKNVKVEEVFIGYHEDAVATTLLQLCQDYNREDLSEDHIRELKEKSKYRLLQCATPDSVLRLPLSELKSDADRLTDIYFSEQPHEGLIQFVQAITGDNGDNHTYRNLAMVTTHSRLLTQRKLDKVKQELGDVDLVWMSLHQFDTEHQFRKQIQKESEQNGDQRPLIYIVQCQQGHDCQNLIASSRYVLWNEYQKLKHKNLIVMILTIQLPRRSDVLFSGFSGGKWTSFHIDELFENQNMEIDLAEVRKLTICELFSEACHRDNIIDFDKILIEAILIAGTKIVEHQQNLQRKMERTRIVSDMIVNNPEFNRIMKQRLVSTIQQKYKSQRLYATNANFETEWLVKKVCDIDNVTCLTSLRIAIRNHLVGELVLILAGILCFMDTNNNLDVFKSGSKHPFLQRLWLNVFQDEQASPIQYDEYFKITVDNGSIEKKNFQAVYTNMDKVIFNSELPFSFLMMRFINNALQQRDVKQLDKELMHEKICERLFGFPLGKIIENATADVSNKLLSEIYLQDYLKMMYSPSSPKTSDAEFKIITETILRKMNHFTLVEVHFIYQEHMSDFENFKTLVECSKCNSEEVKTFYNSFRKKKNKQSDVFLGEMMLQFLLEKLSPDENDLLPKYELKWIEKVDKCCLAVETTLQSMYQGQHGALQDIKLKWKSLMLLKSYVFNISLEFSKKTNAIQPIKFWKVIENLHTEHSQNIQQLTVNMLLGVENVIKDSNAALVIQVLGTRVKIACTFCEDCVYHPVDLPCGHKFCKICLQRNLIITEQQMDYSCVATNCRRRFPNILFDQFPNQKMKELYERQDTLRERCQRFFCYFLSEILFEIAIHNEDVQSRKVTEKLVRMFSERKTVNVLLDSPQNEDVILSFTMHQLLNERYETTKEQLKGWLFGLNFSAGNLFEQRYNKKAVVLLANCLEERELLKIKTNDPNSIQNKLLQSIKVVADFLETDVLLSFESLKYVAQFRVILSELSDLLHSTYIDKKNSHPNLQKILEKVSNICSKEKYAVSGHFLARTIFRKYGKSSLSTVCESFNWIFDLRETQQNDVYAVVEGNYVMCRTAVVNTYMNYKSSDAQRFVQNDSSLPVLYRVLLAVNQEVVITAMRNNSYERYKLYKARIADFLHKIYGKTRLNYNQKLWADDNLFLEADDLLPRNADNGGTTWQIVELLQHFKLTVDLTQNTLFQPLKDMVFHPGYLKNSFLPGMPEDEVYKKFEIIKAQKGNDYENISLYECPNGHLYTIGDCGRPWETSRCNECNAVVGGKSHVAQTGNRKIEHSHDQTMSGYCLGNSNTRKHDESVRIYSYTITTVLRLILHLAMYNGTLYEQQVIRQIIQVPQNVGNVKRFLWDHLVKDLDILASNLHKSRDDICVIIHLLLSQIQSSQGNWNQNWITQINREQWETDVVNNIIRPVFHNVDRRLRNAEQAILNAGRESSKLDILYETNITNDETKPSGFGHPFSMPELWGYRNHVTIEDMRVKMEHANKLQNTEILQLFCEKLQDLVLLRDLPAILSLQQKLCRRFHLVYSSAQADEKTVNQFLESLDNDLERREYENLFQGFIRVWQLIHDHLPNFAFRVEIGQDPISLPPEHCRKDCTMDSPISMFMPNESGQGMCSFVVVRFLMKIQNDFIADYCQKRHIKAVEKEVDGRNISDKLVISFTEDRDFLPLVQANASYSTELGAGLNLSYDFLNIQTEVEDRFIKSKPLLKVKVSFIAYREDYQTDRARLLRLNTVIPQESLAEYRKQLEADAKRMILVDLNNVLYVLDIALGYVVSMGISDEMRQISLQDFVRKKLQLNEDMDIGVMQRLQLRHAKYVWLHLSLERAKMLMDMRQDPLPHLDKSYRVTLDKQKEDQLKQLVARNFQVPSLLEVLYEFCLLFIGKVNFTDPNYVDDSNYPLGFSLDLYQDEKDYKGLTVGFDDNGFPADILHKHAWSAFHTVYAVYKKQRK